MTRSGVRWLAAGVWLAVLAAWTAALLMPVPERAVRDAGVSREGAFWFGKSLHVGVYAVLAATSVWLPLPRRWRWAPLLLLSLHAFATEALQNLVPTRTGSLRDVGLDHLGILIGVAVTRWRRRAQAPAP